MTVKMTIREWWSVDELAGQPKAVFETNTSYRSAMEARVEVGNRFKHRLIYKDYRGVAFDNGLYVQHVSFKEI